MNDDHAYWVPFRVKGGQWIKTGPFSSRDEALRERQDMKAFDCDVDVHVYRTSAEMDKLIEDMNGGTKRIEGD